MIFYVYIDRTLGDFPYVFCVGKGKSARVKLSARNDYHQKIGTKYGRQREVLMSTKDESFAFDEETRLIAFHNTYHYDNPKGANFTRGGDGSSGHKCSPETRLKMSFAQYGKTRSAAQRKTISDTLMGRIVPLEVREKISASMMGVPKAPFSDEHRRRLRDVKLGVALTEEHKTNIKAAMKASPNVGHPIDEDTRGRISAKLTGLKQSPETIAKRSASLKRAHARRKAEKMKREAGEGRIEI